MHALAMLHRLLAGSCPRIHTKRLASLLAAVEAALSGSRLALSELGRGLRNRVAVKHNIKRIDRLRGQGALHAETRDVYESLTRHCLTSVQTPLILIDWSDLTPDLCFQLLRASVALEGRSVTLYEEVHPLARATSRRAHAKFLTRIKAGLPPGCTPILITDAGQSPPVVYAGQPHGVAVDRAYPQSRHG